MKRTPMKRSAWPKRKAEPRQIERDTRASVKQAPPDREARIEARAARMAASMEAISAERDKRPPVAIAQNLHAAAPATAKPKEDAVRSEPYRRLVAAMPCAHCGAVGYSQHAHENVGKGMGLKVDDRRAMPLCCTRPGIEGCHQAFDQYRLVPGGRDGHHAAGAEWAAKTRKAIEESGKWPKGVPRWID